MATPLAGALGSVDFGASAATQETQITEWKATIERDHHDTSDFSAQDYHKTAIGGMYDLKGTVRGLVALDVLPLLTDVTSGGSIGTADFVLTSDTNNTYTFIGIISNLTVVVEKRGMCVFTVAFESSGEVVRATA